MDACQFARICMRTSEESEEYKSYKLSEDNFIHQKEIKKIQDYCKEEKNEKMDT